MPFQFGLLFKSWLLWFQSQLIQTKELILDAEMRYDSIPHVVKYQKSALACVRMWMTCCCRATHSEHRTCTASVGLCATQKDALNIFINYLHDKRCTTNDRNCIQHYDNSINTHQAHTTSINTIIMFKSAEFISWIVDFVHESSHTRISVITNLSGNYYVYLSVKIDDAIRAARIHDSAAATMFSRWHYARAAFGIQFHNATKVIYGYNSNAMRSEWPLK